MRPTNTNTTATLETGFHKWNSPLPYLFGSLALMFGLIAFALIILACSYRKSFSNPRNENEEEKSVKPGRSASPEIHEPKFVVLMPGDDNPTYVANPVVIVSSSSSSSSSSSTHNTEQVKSS
ncbi:hypothetical protein RJ641_023038 [Dillenia turbinata]|uniref:Uncharacterized protein n=1 Tax=Dillenia turbinata TaxID=194707 RepID=A0AAN8UP05_9MAGN